MDLLERMKQKLEEQETEKTPKKAVKIEKVEKVKKIHKIPFISVISEKAESKYEINKSIELNSIKTLFANRFGTTTNMRKADMVKALIKMWKEEI
jgi:hypothetical protein